MRKTWKQQFKSAFFGMVMGILVPSLAMGQATLLPNAKQQYVDDLGNPVASGKVDYFVPGTSTRKTVWLDAAQTTPSTNPVLLDAAGRPQPTGQTYGSGSYRQRVVDQNGLTIWDAVTTSTGGTSGGGGGTPTIGDGMQVGTLLPYSGMTAPANYLFSYGQPVSRTQYTQLLAAVTITGNITCVSGNPTISGLTDTSQVPIGAAVESVCLTPTATVVSKTPTTLTMSSNATASQTVTATIYPWGNGDGATTFNVPDMRGRVPYGRTNMGGTSSLVMTQTYYGNNPNATGATGGLQSWAITQPSLPNYSPVFHGTLATISVTTNRADIGVGAGSANSGGGSAITPPTAFTSVVSTGPYTPAGAIDPLGSGAPIPTVSPGATVNWIIKAIPDTISVLATTVTLPVVAGDYACFSNTSGGILDCGYSPKLTIPTDVRAYGALCDGTTDDHVAIQSALNVTKAIMIPGNCSIGTSTITMNASGQTILGVNKGLSKLTSFATSVPNITINSSLGNVRIAHLGINKVNVPVSGGDGIHFNGYVDTSTIDDVYVTNQYIGISLADSNYGTITNNIISNTVSDGLRMSNPNLSGNYQWVLFNNLVQFAGGWHYNVVTPPSGFAKASMGNWSFTYGFNATLGGIAFHGNSTVPIQGVRIDNTFLGNDGGPEILLDTFNTSIGPHQLSNVYAETNTSGPCIQITANNNGGTTIDNSVLAGCFTAGVNNASNNVSVTGGMALSAGTYGIINSGGLTVSGMNLNGAGTGPVNNTGTYIGRLNTPAAANTAVTVAEGGTGATTFTANLPVIGNGISALGQGTVSGSTTKFVTTTGSLVSGNCAKWDASGNLIDAGGTCGGGGGGSPGGADTNVQINNAGAFAGYAGFVFDKVSKITLGVPGTSVGAVAFGNATSGTETISPATGALGSGIATLPAGTYNIVGDTLTQTLTNKTISGASNTLTNVATTSLTGTLQAAQEPAHTGDVTNTAGSLALTLATVNANVGSFGSTTQCTTFTVNAKGLITAASQSACISGLVVGTTAITSGSANGILFDNSGGVLQSMAAGTNGQLVLGNTSNPPQWGTMSQDCTITNTGVTTCLKTNNVAFTSLATAAVGQIPGETSTGNASAGNVGQYLESVIASGSAVAVATSGTPQNITGMTITLTAGDWDVDMQAVIYDSASTVLHNYDTVSISTTTGTIDTTVGRFSSRYGAAANIQNNVLPATGGVTMTVPPLRFSVSGSTQLFATVQCGWSGAGTPTAFGILRARRAR